MPKTKYSLTDEHRAQLKPHNDRWIANAMRTAPMTADDRASAARAIDDLYRAAALPVPARHAFALGPISGALAATVAAGVWWIRENPGHHAELFGRLIDEAELMAAIPIAMHALFRKEPITDAATREATAAATYEATRDATDAATAAATYEATDAATYEATRDATDAATAAATREATDAATREATDAATDHATAAATSEATREATAAATTRATFAATRAATDDATFTATRDATDAATRVATDAATDETTSVATFAAMFAATAAATDDATFTATRDATDTATRAATAAATRDATDTATRAATAAATAEATDAATRAATAAATAEATDAATRDATDAATRDATRAATARVATFLCHCAPKWLSMRTGGNEWSGWVSYLTFFRDVANLGLPEYAKFAAYEQAAIHAGVRYMHAKFWLACDFPSEMHVDERNRLHCETGPAKSWRDGFPLYRWHGTPVAREIIERPETITIAQIEAESNGEIRRIMIERYGRERYVRDSGAERVQADRFGTLYRKRFADGSQRLWVHVVNGTIEPDGTRREFTIPVHPELRPLRDPADLSSRLGEPQELTARNAVASTYRMTGEQYEAGLVARS